MRTARMYNYSKKKETITKYCFVFLLIVIFLPFSSNSQTYTNTLEDTTFTNIWIGTQTIDSGFSHSGYHYSLTDSLEAYGLGVEMFFPEEIKGSNAILEIEGWVKSSKENAYSLFVFTLEKDGKTIFWKGIPLSTLLTNKDKWFRFYDSLSFPANITSAAKIKAFLWNAGQKQQVGIDDLKISFKKKDGLSYLPEITSNIYSQNIQGNELLYTNNYYSIFYDKTSKQIKISSQDRVGIINNLFYYVEISGFDDSNSKNDNFLLKGVKSKNGKTVLKFTLKTKFNKVKMQFQCRDESSKIDFLIEEKFTKDIDIARSALVIDGAQAPSEVYRFNRQSHTKDFQNEYWLDKEGIKLGDADSSLIIYHNKEISSLQYDKEKSHLIINLDWEKDHPFLRFPLNNDSTDWKLEQSFSTYKKGDKREYSFSAYAGNRAKNLARFMKNPSGFEATYIWTEHADFSDIRTNRATYFGSENIDDADSAVGGFVKYDIPITKSVFYDNPDSITNFDTSNGRFTSLECSIKPDSVFSNFLDEIYEKGSEICLHTPEQFTTSDSRLEEAMTYIQNKYKSPSWIDHGYNNKEQNNREDLVCDASLKGSPFYSIEKWNRYNIKYFWNPYYEDYFTFMELGFNSSIEKAYTGWGDFIPKPDYWQHISKTENIYHWPTASALFVVSDGLWDYYFNTTKFDDFIDNWSVEINHCYPSWVDPQKGFWTYDSDSVIVAQEGFNRTLKLMSDLRNERKLNVCTVKDFMDYRLSTDKVDYEILIDGRIKVANNSGKTINGLSFATRAKYVLIDRLKPEQKVVGDDLVFWFDIGDGESKIIRHVD